MKIALKILVCIATLATGFHAAQALPFAGWFGHNAPTSGVASENAWADQKVTISMTKGQAVGLGIMSSLAAGFAAFKLWEWNKRATERVAAAEGRAADAESIARTQAENTIQQIQQEAKREISQLEKKSSKKICAAQRERDLKIKFASTINGNLQEENRHLRILLGLKRCRRTFLPFGWV